MRQTTTLATRVLFCALLTVGLFAVPSLALSGRSSSEPVETIASAAVTAEVGASTAATVVEVATSVAETAMSIFTAAAWENAALGDIDPKVFATALRAAEAAVTRGDVGAPTTLTVIDFSRPSTQERMWVVDLRTKTLLFEEHVSHGRGSGKTMATSFSNIPESNQSSLGLYRTAETYIGKHGYSLRLDGLERGVNNRARERAIVMHGADYVNAATAKANGYLGRSLGCPALRPAITRQVIDAVKNGGLLFAYYPDAEYLSESEYLN
jgi:hypothetical protein